MATKRTAKKTETNPLRSSLRFSSAKSGKTIVQFRQSSPRWEANLEENLVQEGLTRAKARDLVKLAAS